MKHSKLPFRIEKLSEYSGFLLSNDGEPLIEIGGPKSLSYAQFIFTACNAYYPMLEALKQAKFVLANYEEGTIGNRAYKTICEAIKQAEAK